MLRVQGLEFRVTRRYEGFLCKFYTKLLRAWAPEVMTEPLTEGFERAFLLEPDFQFGAGLD